MNTPDRTTIIKGPAEMAWNSQVVKFGGDFSVDFVTEFFDVVSSSFGRGARRVKNRYVEIKGTPLEFTGLSAIYPYATKNIGDTIFGASDLPAVITPKNGAPLTVANVMPTKLPGITLHPSKSILRDGVWTGLCANAADPSAQASFFSFGSVGTNAALTAVDFTKIPNALYNALFNSVTYVVEDGIDIDFNLGLDDDLFQGLTINKRITELEAAAKFMPTSLTEAGYATLMGWDTVYVGGDPFSGNLVVSGDRTGKPQITLAKMMVQPGGVTYGRKNRLGEVTLASVRQVATGSLTALWTIGVV